MKSKLNSWDVEYKKGSLGNESMPEFPLGRFLDDIPKGKALDIGGGNGHNSLFLAKAGFDVQLIDISSVAVDNCLQAAKQSGLSLQARVADMRDFEIEPDTYTLIVASYSLQILRKNELEKVLSAIKAGIVDNGFALAAVLSVADSGFAMRRETSQEVEERTFYVAERDIHVHYFEKDELLGHFRDWKMFHFSDSLTRRTNKAGQKIPWVGGLCYFGQKEKE